MNDDSKSYRGSTSVTDPGPAPKKIFNGALAIKGRINRDDPDQVFDLAAVLARSSRRRMMEATHDELRAVARFAVRAGTIASHAVAVVEALTKLDAQESQSRVLELIKIVRST